MVKFYFDRNLFCGKSTRIWQNSLDTKLSGEYHKYGVPKNAFKDAKRRDFIMKRTTLSRLLAIVLMLVMLFALQAPALACSSMELTSKEGDHYWFRTCDMDDSFNVFGENGSMIDPSYLVSYPAGKAISFTTGDVTAKYTIVGMSFGDSLALLDGINEAGLVGGLQDYREGTSYPGDEAPEGYELVSGMEALTWFLAQCSTVDEVIKLVEKTYVKAIHVDGIPYSELSATMHLVFVDANGKSIVLENGDPENPGVYTVYDSIGVMTNSPSYPDQLENLSAYIGASPELRAQDITSITMKGVTVKGKASNTDWAFPAANTSMNRFIRNAMWRYAADGGSQIPSKDMLARGSKLFLNASNVVKEDINGLYKYSSIADGKAVGQAPGYTMYTVYYDISNRSMAILPYDSVVWTELSVADANKTARATYSILRGGAGATAKAGVGETAPTVEAPVVAPTAPVSKDSYVVQAGDFLAKIAQNVYGDAGKWNTIYEANRNLLKDPNALQPGQVLVIPAA